MLAIVDPLLPEGVSVLSEVRGPFAASGPLDDLQINTDLQTPRGQLQFDGRFDLASDDKTYDATLLARDIQLSEWIESGPTTRLAVEGRIDGTGTDPATLDARFDLIVLPSLFEGARVDSSIVRFTLADGLATADTFAIRTRVGSVDGRGSFGLAESRSGSLILDIEIPDLAEWNAWLVEGRNPARIEEDVSELFETFGPGASLTNVFRVSRRLVSTVRSTATAQTMKPQAIDTISVSWSVTSSVSEPFP